MKRIRAGVVGTGFIGVLHIEAIRRIPDAEVVAISAPKPELESAQQRFCVARGYPDWRALVADPEVTVVHNCAPNVLHDAVNRGAIERGTVHGPRIGKPASGPLCHAADGPCHGLDRSAHEQHPGVLHCDQQGSWHKADQPYATFRDGWRGNAFIDACLLSAPENRWVELPQEDVRG